MGKINSVNLSPYNKLYDNTMNVSEASREIMWNVGHIGNSIAMYTLFALSLAIASLGFLRHVELWISGKTAPELKGNYLTRFKNLFVWGAAQKGVVRSKIPAIAHTLVYVGFLVLLFTTTMVMLDHDFGIKIYHGRFYLLLTILSDVLGFGVLVGCLIFAHRRLLSKPDLIHSKPADYLFLGVLALLIIQGFLLEGLRIYATNDPWAYFSPIGLLFSKFFWFLSIKATKSLHFITWWFHTITVFLVFALAPYTKFFHIISSSINLFFKDSGRHKGALKSPGDLEAMMEGEEEFSLGLESIKDYSWKQILDLDACTSCGRCQDACPAYNSGKPLSPKWLILDTRNHAVALHSEDKLRKSFIPKFLRTFDKFLTDTFFLSYSGVNKTENGFNASGEYRAKNPLTQTSVKSLGINADERIAGGVIDPDVFWTCTTCMACVEACPVGINHVDQIVENRRNMVLMHGEIPNEAQTTLRALENRANPYGAPEDRINWTDGLDVPILKEGDSVDILYWVGCVSSFDPRKQKIAQALVKIFNKLEISYGILGKTESCTGDPARRLGEENLFQILAKQNIATLNSVNYNTLISNCPHCFNTIKNEYSEFGDIGNGKTPKILHHSQYLTKLLKEGKLNLKEGTEESFTFHDPCYLGRYNDEYEAPRKALKAVKGLKIIEMKESRNKGKCCGAGGGHFWMDLKIGERVNTQRVEQAAETGAKNIATACPFCMQMLEDGIKATGRDAEMNVRDIAEVIADNLI